jgi:hypothetical protein
MRKLIKIFICFLVFFSMIVKTGNAQILKGNWNLGGTILGSGVKPPKNGYYELGRSSIEFLPKIGYILNNKFEIGINAGYGREKKDLISTATNSISKGNNYKIEPYLRLYKPINSKLFFVIEGSAIKYSFGKQNGESTNISGTIPSEFIFNETYKNTKVGIFVRPFLNYFVSKKIAIEGSLGTLGFGHFKNFKSTSSKRNNVNPNDPFSGPKTFYEETLTGYTFDLNVLKVGLGLQFYL